MAGSSSIAIFNLPYITYTGILSSTIVHFKTSSLLFGLSVSSFSALLQATCMTFGLHLILLSVSHL